ncbi:MAG: T9SS C-terminal target domain-containing protein [Bacteroidetes bacterium]|nr:MAG: T9SS C-terminal target domain-containing protein [Bacteroidota bacterium]
MRKILFTALATLLFTNLFGQVAINSVGVAATENFNTLAATGTTSTTLPTGWAFFELGNNSNATYGVDDGTLTSGNTYSYGAGTNTDRALGMLLSGSLSPRIGAFYVNKTGSTVTSVTISFTCEQWRRTSRSPAGRDTAYFSYGINKASIDTNSGTWVSVPDLNLISPTTGATGSLNGNSTANRTAVTYTFQVNLNNNDTLALRWIDANVAGGADDGLGIDDFSITFNANTPVGIPPVSNLIFTPNTTTRATLSFNKTNYIDSAYSTLVFVKQGSAVTQGTPNAAVSNYTANTNFSAATSVFQNDANAKCVMNGDDSVVSITGLLAGTTYHVLVYVVRNADSVYSAATTANGITIANPAAATTLAVNTINAVNALRVQWTKPAAYNNTNSTTVVFVKESTAINNLTPSAVGTSYVADTSFTGSGTKFEQDTLARCVYNGDSNVVTIGGLNNNTTYHVLVFHYRQTDSLYSAGVAQSGKTPKALPPGAVTGINFTGIGIMQNTLNWTKPVDYVDSTMSVLVFARRNSAITVGTPTVAANTYTANSNFSAAQVKYQNDTNARCVYVGDDSNATITGLEVNTNYHYLVLVTQDIDTLYSVAATANQTTRSLPAAVTNITFNTTTANATTLTWNKPLSYANNNFTTLVFLKELSSVNQSTPSFNASAYTPDTAMGIGTKYQHDSLAFCVFNADTNRVTVGGLKVKTLYHALVLVYRVDDSTYATGTVGNVSTLDTLQPPPAYPKYNISQINKTNTSTGVPDSNGVKVSLSGRVLGFNQRTTGIQFALNDATGGITIFNATKSFGITPISEGDSIYVQGTVSSFRGLCQINADSVWKGAVSSGNFTATAVTKLGENTENILVKLSAVRFATAPTVTSFPATSTVYQIITSTNDTFTMRVLATSALAGQPIPTTPTFDVTGIGSQFSTSTTSPFAFNGYQLYPRGTNDIVGITPPPSPKIVSIASINKTNATTGVPDSLDAKVNLRGIVIGFNQRASGLLFVIDDGTGGISLFNNSKNFGYTVNEGDSIYVQGTVAQFRGLTQINIDTLWNVTGSSSIYAPIPVTALSESTENKLVRLNGVRFETEPTGNNWPTANTSINIITANNDVLVLRILATSDLAGTPLPSSETFDIIGLNGQFTTATPALGGYQIIPRDEDDVIESNTVQDSIGAFDLVSPANNTIITLDSPFTSSVTISWRKPSVFGNVDSILYYFDVDTINGDFSDPYVSFETSGDPNDTSLTLTEQQVKDIVDGLGMVPGEVFYGKWEIYAESVSDPDVFNISSQTRNITIDYVLNSGLKNIGFETVPMVYPNPAASVLTIYAKELIYSVKLFNITGEQVSINTLPGFEYKLDVSTLPQGLYLLEINGAKGEHLTKRVVIR